MRPPLPHYHSNLPTALSNAGGDQEMGKDRLHVLPTLVLFAPLLNPPFLLCQQHIGADDGHLASIKPVGLMVLEGLTEEGDKVDEDIVIESRELLQETAGPWSEVLSVQIHGGKELITDDWGS